MISLITWCSLTILNFVAASQSSSSGNNFSSSHSIVDLFYKSNLQNSTLLAPHSDSFITTDHSAQVHAPNTETRHQPAVQKEVKAWFNRKGGVISSSSQQMSILTALYSIPSVHSMIFCLADDEFKNRGKKSFSEIIRNSFATANALCFTKLRLSDKSLCLNRIYLESLTRTMQHDEAGSIDIEKISFEKCWKEMFKALPQGVLNLFNINVTLSSRSLTFNWTKTKSLTKNLISVDFELDEPLLLSDYIKAGFRSESNKIISSERNGINLSFETSVEITSKPDIFTLRPFRVQVESGNLKFKKNVLIIEDVIKLPNIEEKYYLAAQIAFDCETGRYFTIARDFGDSKWYKYTSNGLVTNVEFNPNDEQSILLFYVLQSSVIPESITNIPPIFYHIYGFKAPPPILGKKRKIDQKVDSIEIHHSQAYIDGIFAVRLGMIKLYPRELSNYMEKMFFKTYPLGSETYSFKPDELEVSQASVEFILSSIAANCQSVLKLTNLFLNGLLRAFDEEVLIVVYRMLLGFKNISLKKINSMIKGIFGSNFFTGFTIFNQLDKIISIINTEIFQSPRVNSILYSNLESDDPDKIVSNSPAFQVKPSEVLPPKLVSIKDGIYFDSIYKDQFRLRNIFKSKSKTFGISINRFDNGELVDKNPIFFGGDDYKILGVITQNDKLKYYAYFVSDYNSDVFINIAPGNSMSFFKLNAENINVFDEIIRHESLFIFFERNSQETLQNNTNPFQLIPPSLEEKIFQSYYEELLLEQLRKFS